VEPEETEVAMPRLSEDVPVATNTHATVEDFFDAVFSVQFVSYPRKLGDKYFPENATRIILPLFNSQNFFLSLYLYLNHN
jgi:hypothetical protein